MPRFSGVARIHRIKSNYIPRVFSTVGTPHVCLQAVLAVKTTCVSPARINNLQFHCTSWTLMNPVVVETVPVLTVSGALPTTLAILVTHAGETKLAVDNRL